MITKLILVASIAISFYWTTANTQAEEPASSISIYSLFHKIKTLPTFRTYGLERISSIGASDNISNSSALSTALEKMDIKTITQIITSQTGYECIIGSDYLIIVPKDDPAKHKLALAKREITIPNLDKLSFEGVYKQINTNKANEGMLLGGPLYQIGMEGGPVSLKAGKYKCYDILNQMALQSNVRCWIIDHTDAFNQITGEMFSPIPLDTGNVSFSAR